ncbi:hypothetical protein CEXT_734931 [Caerostris extrusa]|uniref:Uncharacterized protein n=1 Tax=Caerostris extrusa TaxID=172846 RepID=A0AAV4Y9U8_CAEEX|nr:hypothetical protein CEXT_734931 [Caerostris extrusa]
MTQLIKKYAKSTHHRRYRCILRSSPSRPNWIPRTPRWGCCSGVLPGCCGRTFWNTTWVDGWGGRLQDSDVVRPFTLESLVALSGAAAAGLARVVQARGYRRFGCVEVLKGQGVRSRLTCSREKEKCTSRSRIEKNRFDFYYL